MYVLYILCRFFSSPLEDGLGQDEELERIQKRLENLELAYLKCKSLIEETPGFISPGTRPSRIEETSERVQRELADIYTHLKGGLQTGGFHWIHSILIKVSFFSLHIYVEAYAVSVFFPPLLPSSCLIFTIP